MGLDIHEWQNREPDFTAPQPLPKNDPDTKPLWPAIISEIEGREYRSQVFVRLNRADAKRRMDVVCLVAVDMGKRHEFGVAKYGVPLVAKNDRDHLSDAYQEILDGIVYFRAEIERCGGFDRKVTSRRLDSVERMYRTLIEMAVDLRGHILERDGR